MRAAFGAVAFCFACVVQAGESEDRYPGLAAAYLVQVDGQDLWAGNADAQLPPASLTKLMTALVVLDDYRPDDVVAIDAIAARATGTRLRLKAGERFTAASLLTAMLMVSANDACAALANRVEGGVDAFVERMNRRAAVLGLNDTHFENPCGFDAPGHHSSAEDLARLAGEAMAHPEIAAIVRQAESSIASVDGKRTHALKNRNALIGTYAPAIGIKTGYTSKAGKCLIALAEKDGRRVLVVMLGAKSRWWDTIGLIEKAFDAANGPR
jgi:D-alanyl-D-alanine carboxypeptidase (penicillin-binding protein 5/6)